MQELSFSNSPHTVRRPAIFPSGSAMIRNALTPVGLSSNCSLVRIAASQLHSIIFEEDDT
jgi:hypothetical protein